MSFPPLPESSPRAVDSPPPAAAAPRSVPELPRYHWVYRALLWVRKQFAEAPTFSAMLLPSLVVAALLYSRSPYTNCIFDEQEALLANPYVNGESGLSFWDAFRRDFWGLPSTRSIGSYRPIPNLVWRLLWQIKKHPWLPHWFNLMFHGVNAALVGSLVFRLSRSRLEGWLAGAIFVSAAVLTEAVSGVVGIADILGGMGILLALHAIRLPILVMPLGVAAAMLFGLFSKESAIVGVPLVAWFALVMAPLIRSERPLRWARGILSLAASVGALIFYVEFRRVRFPVKSGVHELDPEAHPVKFAMQAFLKWFAQPKLPADPVNNPLVGIDMGDRVQGALDVFAQGVGQTILPWTLAGDYSFPQQVTPGTWFAPGVLIGGLCLFLLPLAGVGIWVWARFRERREESSPSNGPGEDLRLALFVALATVWVAVSYFPHSNIAVLLPTVRAERFWYVPMIGLAPLYALLLARAIRWRPQFASPLATRLGAGIGVALACVFLGFQAQSGRLHALDYSNDLTFWRSTARNSPNSAKAHLNYSVMLGARGYKESRLKQGAVARGLAPKWPMGHVYYGDALCRNKQSTEAWSYYKQGFELGPNDLNLIALGLQCLWDEGRVSEHEEELLEMAEKHRGTWLAYLARDIAYNGEKHGGVDPKYRPRGYNQGPKKK